MDIKKIYISGKITGLPIDEVISKFQAAEAKIRITGPRTSNNRIGDSLPFLRVFPLLRGSCCRKTRFFPA